MSNQYHPWIAEGISELDYWKKRYLEARQEIRRIMDAAAPVRSAYNELLPEIIMLSNRYPNQAEGAVQWSDVLNWKLADLEKILEEQ